MHYRRPCTFINIALSGIGPGGEPDITYQFKTVPDKLLLRQEQANLACHSGIVQLKSYFYTVVYLYFSFWVNCHDKLFCIHTDNWDKVQYSFSRLVSMDVLTDIQDGNRYKKQSGFFSVPEHAGLVLCTDGVPLFKSSGMCID